MGGDDGREGPLLCEERLRGCFIKKIYPIIP